jgi:hypothetical protein
MMFPQERVKRQAASNREVKRTAEEQPSLAMLIGQHFEFESPRQDGQGGKQSMNTTVVSGRSVAKDPRSLIVFYRSHLASLGNLLESILRNRKPSAKDVIVQADLSTTNLIRDAGLMERFNFKLIGCSAHARRPFALFEHEDPVYCAQILHQFTGIAMHEECLDVHGRNLRKRACSAPSREPQGLGTDWRGGDQTRVAVVQGQQTRRRGSLHPQALR